MQMLAGIITEGQYVAILNEEQALGTLFIPEEDEDGMIDYFYDKSKVIEVIRSLGYNDAEEIAKEVLKLSHQVRQNARVKMITMVNSSKRPSNMASVQIQV